MRLRTISMVGLGVGALALALVQSGTASASGAHHSLRASAGFHGHATASPFHASPAGKCGTSFGPELPTPDGIIAWNDTSGTTFDEAGGADVVCASATNIKKVKVYGYFGTAPTESFNVTFYGDSADPSEPEDGTIICSYTGLTGAAGGQYPTHVLTKLVLPTKCALPAGTAWVAVQNNDSAGPWYWEMQDTQSGSTGPDWVDRHDVFGSGCTTFDNDRYLVDCLGYPYADWMLKLK
jgi:hypothetical protein